jgi:quercetin dioxygenase-like cupin family protein
MYINAKDMKFVPKVWGYELWITNTEKYCGKILFIKAGHKCSLHCHKIKDEVLYLQSGKCMFTYEKMKTTILKVGDAYHVLPNQWHQMEAETDVTIIEISTQHFDEDSIKILGTNG